MADSDRTVAGSAPEEGADRLDGPPVVGTAVAEERVAVASHTRLMWWRFRKHKMALVAGFVIVFFYLVALAADFLSYAEPHASDAGQALIPPQPIHWFDDGDFGPYVHPVRGARDPVTFQREYVVDETRKVPVHFFTPGYEYEFLGLIPTNIHLIGVDRDAAGSIHLLGTDRLGRDNFSRLLHATRTSLTIGLVGVGLSLILGVALGGISGFYGGMIDTVIQRGIEILRSIPTIPLWMGLAAAMPRDWSVTQVYFVLTLIIAVIGWTQLARVVRGRFLQLRDEDFVSAARLAGSGSRRIIFVHMLPLFVSHIIAATTLALPLMIIAETSLSFLGLGLRPPAISWGVMLQEAQNVQAVALSPWLLIPVVPVVLAILAFNFLGDGLRDAADPYGH